MNKTEQNQEQDLRTELQSYMKDHNYSMTQTSRGLGISTSAISQWLKSAYNGDNERIDRQVSDYLVRENEKTQFRSLEIPFVMTNNAKIIFKVARTCHLYKKMGMIYGASGLGKTVAGREYALKHPDTIYIHANRSFTPKVLFRKLSKELGYAGKGYVAELLDEIIDKIKDSGRLIIVDQANFLNVTSLHLLRTLYDEASIGIILLGTEELYWNIKGQKEEYAQVYTRITVPVKLGKWKADDCKQVINAVLPDDGMELYKDYYTESGGNGKVLENILFNSMKIAEANNGRLTTQAIKMAGNMVIK